VQEIDRLALGVVDQLGEDEGLRHVVEERSITRFAFAEGRRGAPELGDLLGEEAETRVPGRALAEECYRAREPAIAFERRVVVVEAERCTLGSTLAAALRPQSFDLDADTGLGDAPRSRLGRVDAESLRRGEIALNEKDLVAT